MCDQDPVVRLHCRHGSFMIHDPLFCQETDPMARQFHQQVLHDRAHHRILLKLQEFPDFEVRPVFHRLFHHLLRSAVLLL